MQYRRAPAKATGCWKRRVPRASSSATSAVRRTSVEFAEWMQRQRELARDVAFVIGGAFGLDARVRAGALSALSLAPWTLPHEMARLVLAEQLYRAGTIVRREPYHKA